MPQLYSEILRGATWRDDNFKDHFSAWFRDTPASFSTPDGDTLVGAGTTSIAGIFKTIIPNTSLVTNPYLVIRGRTDLAVMHLKVILNKVSGSETFNLVLTPSYATYTFPTTGTGTAASIYFIDQQEAGIFYIDKVALCKKPPIIVSTTDDLLGEIIRSNSTPDFANLTLINLNGKYVRADQDPIGWGDYLYVWAGLNSLTKIFGGRIEEISPERMPEDIVPISARGWANDIGEIILTKEYLSITPKNLIIDIIDNQVDYSTGTPYRISRAYVQDIGSSIGYMPFGLRPAWDAIREVGDLLVGQGAAPEIWVDAAENLHVAPVGNFGASDPTPSTYPTPFAIGSNQIINKFRRDIYSLKNRVHYFAIAQSPADADAWTENNASSWGSERLSTFPTPGTTATFTNESTIKKVGSYSVKVVLENVGNAYEGAFFYPSAKNLALNIAALGSKKAPPLFDFWARFTDNTDNPPIDGGGAGRSNKVFFATDATNRFEYDFVDKDGILPRSIIGCDGTAQKLVKDNWYHLILPIGPFGADQYKLADVGSPDWANINYVGLSWGTSLITGKGTFYLDGWRILGARYRRVIDNSGNPATANLGRREIPFFDPVSKDEILIRDTGRAELKRLRNPVLRGSFVTSIVPDLLSGQQIIVTAPSADLNATLLRVTKITHHLALSGFKSTIECSDDLTNTQPLERWKLANVLYQTGHPGIKDRESYDLRASSLDPSITVVEDLVP